MQSDMAVPVTIGFNSGDKPNTYKTINRQFTTTGTGVMYIKVLDSDITSGKEFVDANVYSDQTGSYNLIMTGKTMSNTSGEIMTITCVVCPILNPTAWTPVGTTLNCSILITEK